MHLFLWLLEWLSGPHGRHCDRGITVAASIRATWREAAIDRQARAWLNSGRALLAKGLWDEAEAQFGMALELMPHIGFYLSKRQQRRLLDELALAGCDLRLKNIQYLAGQLDR